MGESKNKGVFVGQDVLKSEAWLSLSGIAPQVYMLFLTKRRMEKEQRKKNKEKWTCTNNGELIFTYRDAEAKYRITPTRFRRAIDMLIDRGFIEIAKPGNGVAKVATEYGLSERWRKYGEADFQRNPRVLVRVGYCRKRKQE